MLMPFDSTKFYTGVNIGWLNEIYGHDLVRQFEHTDWGPMPDPIFEPYITAIFLHLKIRKIKVVRFFLHEGLEGIYYLPRGASPGDASGLSISAPELNISNVDLIRRIEVIMQIAQDNGIQVYWCLLDGARVTDRNTSDWERRALNDIICNSTVSGLFMDNVLSNVIDVLKRYPNNVFAIDLINEMDWLWYRARIPASTVISFTEALRDYIKTRFRPLDIQITSSFASYSRLSEEYDSFHFFDFYDYHRYYDRSSDDSNPHGSLPSWVTANFLDKPCIIGEIGNWHSGSLNRSDGNTASEQEQQVATASLPPARTGLLYQAIDGGYFGALAWRYTCVNGREGSRRDPLPNDFITRLLRKGNSRETFRRTIQEFMAVFTAVRPIDDNDVDAFQEFERPVWIAIRDFINAIPSERRPV